MQEHLAYKYLSEWQALAELQQGKEEQSS